MTKKERVIRALQHKESDIIPYHIDLTMQEAARLQEATGDPDFLRKSGVHLEYCQYWGWPAELPDQPGYFKDAFGVVWNRNGADKDIGVVDIPQFCDADISFWKEPVLDEKRLRAEYESLLLNSEDRFTFAGIGFSMFERCWSLRGMEDILCDMMVSPGFVRELCDKILEYNLKIIDIANEYPFDGFYFGDDWGQQKGQIMGDKLWRELIKPMMKAMYERAKKNGKYILQHSCGDIEALLPDLIEIGLDCYQTFQPEIYDVEKIKKEYGSSLCFWGGISTQQLLPYGSPDKVKAETIRTMQIMGKGGGYIAAPTHAVPGDVPIENILAMLDVFEHQSYYL